MWYGIKNPILTAINPRVMAGFRSLYRYRGNLESDEILFSAKNGETITEAMVNSPYPELDVQGSLSFY